MRRPLLSLRERQYFFGNRARLLYELLAWGFRNETDVRFMNYGYAGDGRGIALPPEEEFERYCAQLYHAVAGQVPLAGKAVLDVGSGRGGGASYIQRHLGAAETVGCELAEHAVAFARKVHGAVPGLSFRQGDATALPFAAESFDAVVNVESAHCYPDRAAFFSEVFRVLKPGGHFLVADFTPPRVAAERARAEIGEDLALAGFGRAEAKDITPEILRALDLDHDRRSGEIRRRFPLGTRRAAQYWAGTKGSWIYRDFAEGRRAYLMYRIVKPVIALPALTGRDDAGAPRRVRAAVPDLVPQSARTLEV